LIFFACRWVDDVDLFTVMLAEFPEEGALVGPTLSCLLGMQYRDLKIGDRFWYESPTFPAAFTPGNYFL
jgi:peroxidase